MCLCLVILNQSKVEIFGCCDEGFCYWMKLTFRHSHPKGYAVSAGQRYVIVIKYGGQFSPEGSVERHA